MRKIVNFHGIGKPGSGYGDACVNLAKAFDASDVDVNFSQSRFRSIANSMGLTGSKTLGNIDFFIGPPPYRNLDKRDINFLKNNRYSIAYFYWEADRLPAHWARAIQNIDEIWAPCKLVESACRKAGFSGVTRIVPTPYDPSRVTNDFKIDIPSQINNKYFVSEDVFKFYSIFEWHHRKGPDVLLKAYWKSFSRDDNVLLLIKTNALGLKGHSSFDIKSDISSIKSKLNLSYYPPVYVVDDKLPGNHIDAIHSSCDCYVAPHRGEGWGMPIVDAILHKNPVLSTKYGGISDYLNSNNSGIIRHKSASVRNMSWSPKIYNKSQRWAEPSVSSASSLMVDCYNNFNKYLVGADSAYNVVSEFSIHNISKVIGDNICQINF